MAERKSYNSSNIKATLSYKLTRSQQIASEEIFKHVINNNNVLVNAVCGAGKTELVYKCLDYYLSNGKIVGFAIPRKDVVIEIYNRLNKDYPNVDIISVYGGNTNDTCAQLIVLTTHQLYRYKKYFDLLILDEADAFPFYNNDLLKSFLNDWINGPIIYLSATLNNYNENVKKIVYVNKRFHNFDLPVPEYIKYTKSNSLNKLKEIIDKMKGKSILIFVPTIEIGRYLSKKTNIPFVCSTSTDRHIQIDLFRKKTNKTLITTSILERGITFFDVQVIVYEADHIFFNSSTLIQISGRVGRKLKAPTGKVYFLSKTFTKEMKECIKEIKKKNSA